MTKRKEEAKKSTSNGVVLDEVKWEVDAVRFYKAFHFADRPQEKFTEGSFALALNADPEVSVYPSLYRILDIVQGTTKSDTYKEGKFRTYIYAQFFRNSKATCVNNHETNDPREVYSTNIVQKIVATDFHKLVVLHEGKSSLPSGKEKDEYYQSKFFKEKARKMPLLDAPPDLSYVDISAMKKKALYMISLKFGLNNRKLKEVMEKQVENETKQKRKGEKRKAPAGTSKERKTKKAKVDPNTEVKEVPRKTNQDKEITQEKSQVEEGASKQKKKKGDRSKEKPKAAPPVNQSNEEEEEEKLSSNKRERKKTKRFTEFEDDNAASSSKKMTTTSRSQQRKSPIKDKSPVRDWIHSAPAIQGASPADLLYLVNFCDKWIEELGNVDK